MQFEDTLYSREKILIALEKITEELTYRFNEFSLDEFFTRPQNKWSAADHLRHLTKTAKRITYAFKMPRFVLATKFGKPDRKSKQYIDVKEFYQRALQRGAQAGDYSPDYFEIPATQSEAEAFQRKTTAAWKKAGSKLIKTADRWSNYQLDKYQLPHPIMGNLTLREILFFTIYHNMHHLNSAQQNIAKLELGEQDEEFMDD